MAEPIKLIGLLFHVFRDGKVQFQGEIIGQPHPDFFLVQYHDRATRKHTTIELIPISAIAKGATMNGRHTDETWQLYRTPEQMNAWYEDHPR